MIQLFIDEKVIGRIEGGHLGGRVDGGWLIYLREKNSINR